jgi:hypothetical protein
MKSFMSFHLRSVCFMNLTADTPLINVLVRMVVPMRREFGCVIDIQQIRTDASYARDVVQQAMTSQVERLREYAKIVDHHLQGAASATGRKSTPPAPAATSPMDGQPTLKRDAAKAARHLLNLIGPMAEPLAIQLEGVTDIDTAQVLAVRACDLVADTRGRRQALFYREQLPESLL